MCSRKRGEPDLRLIPGGLGREILFGPLRIVVSPEVSPPFSVEALVAEEDTFLVLSADPRVRDPKEHPMRIMTRLIETRPETPGTVIPKGGKPLRLLAVVHDLEREPSSCEEWVASALKAVFIEIDKRGLKSAALPLLGTLYGGLKDRRFAVLLRETIEKAPLRHLKRLWLVLQKGTAPETIRVLESALENAGEDA